MSVMYLRDLKDSLKKEWLEWFKTENRKDLIKADEKSENVIIGDFYNLDKCEVE